MSRHAAIALRVALECVRHGYTAGRIVERMRELGADVRQSDVHPHAICLANEIDRLRTDNARLTRERDDARAIARRWWSHKGRHDGRDDRTIASWSAPSDEPRCVECEMCLLSEYTGSVEKVCGEGSIRGEPCTQDDGPAPEWCPRRKP